MPGDSGGYLGDNSEKKTHDDPIGNAFNDLGTAMGTNPLQVDANDPNSGSSLNTADSNAERVRLGNLMAQMQQQAQTGEGPWHQAFNHATQQAGASAQALGQSMPGVGYGAALRNIGNAQGAVSQRAAGQEELLRNQAMISGQDQLSGALAGIGQTDAAQAAQESAVKQNVRDANQAAIANAKKNAEGIKDGISKAASMGMSDGGKVPGKAYVFGDDEKNDTVKAKLSPGEIVIPRSHAGSPEAAADFVRALHASKSGVQHFADGGGVASNTLSGNINGGDMALTTLLPSIGLQTGFNKLSGGIQDASLKNGSLLNTAPYNQNRDMQLGNADLQAQRAAGGGPSVVPQKMQNTIDENTAAALQAMQGRGQGAAAGAGNAVMQGAIEQQKGAGGAGEAKLGETTQARGALNQALQRQRAQDLAFAQAKQQAAFRNTMQNMGLSMEQQANMRNAVASAGNAAAAYGSLGGKSADTRTTSDDFTGGRGSVEDITGGNSHDSDEYSGGRGSAEDISSPDDKWQGGYIEDNRAADFVKALRAAKR